MWNLFRTTSRNYWQQIPFLLVVHFIGVRSLGDVRSLEDSDNLGAVATRVLVSDQSTSAFLESPSPSRFGGKVIILEFDYNAVLETAPPSVLKAASGLTTSGQSTSAIPEYLSSPVCPLRRRLGDRATLGAEAASGLTSDPKY
jgi:hypothetical protein